MIVFMYIRQREPAKIVSKEWKLTIVFLRGLNVVSPEGNGRAIREFMRLLFLHNGYVVQWDAVDVEALLSAMIDSVYDTAHLEQILKQCLAAAPDSR